MDIGDIVIFSVAWISSSLISLTNNTEGEMCLKDFVEIFYENPDDLDVIEWPFRWRVAMIFAFIFFLPLIFILFLTLLANFVYKVSKNIPGIIAFTYRFLNWKR